MKKRFDLIPALLIAVGVGAVLLAWWLLMRSIAGLEVFARNDGQALRHLSQYCYLPLCLIV